ncbi:helix-turn-helix domain-containing protein [Nocardia sp. NPDC003482]
MNRDQAIAMGEFLRAKREQAGLSQAEVARRAGADKTQVSRFEAGLVLTPRTDLLQAIGAVVGVSLTDILAAGKWISPRDLPSMSPYLHAKYQHLPGDVLEKIEAYIETLARERDISFDDYSEPQRTNDD